MTYRPDAAARALAYENARRHGARASRGLVTIDDLAERLAAEGVSPEEVERRLAVAVDPEEVARRYAEAVGQAMQTVAQVYTAALRQSMAAWAEAVRPAFERMPAWSIAFARTLELTDWDQVLRRARPGPEGPPRPGTPGDRVRHGRAAWCPRHGATRGGLCRRCVR